MAESYTIEKYGTLADYLLRLQQLRQAGAREAAAADMTGCASVTIMTIHKSKGLEFPVVLYPRLMLGAKVIRICCDLMQMQV